MAQDQSALLQVVEMLKASDHGELMRKMLTTMLQALIDAEAAAHIGAAPHERTDTRVTQRNGTRDKLVTTGVGDLTVHIPKVRTSWLVHAQGRQGDVVVLAGARRRRCGA